jgi:hypothetical protein
MQVPSGASAAVQVLDLIVKSAAFAPPSATAMVPDAAAPVLVTVKEAAVLVSPIGVCPKSFEVGSMDRAEVPCPVNLAGLGVAAEAGADAAKAKIPASVITAVSS